MARVTASTSFKSPSTTEFCASFAASARHDRSCEPKLSKTTPRSVLSSFNNAETRWLPIKPAPPETKTRFHPAKEFSGTSDNAVQSNGVNRATLVEQPDPKECATLPGLVRADCACVYL